MTRHTVSKHSFVRLFVVCLVMAVAFGLAAPAHAATIVEVTRDDAGATALANVMVTDPETLTGAVFEAVPPSGAPHGTSDDLSFFPTSGDRFAVLTTGSALIADSDNTSQSSGELLGGGNVRGDTDLDVTVMRLDLNAPAAANCLRLDFAFYSDEYAEFVGTQFNDAFIAELDDSTWSTSGSQITAPDNFAFDNEGDPVTINTTGAAAMSELNAGGTTYDGATTLLEAATPVTPGAHKLYLSIFDQGDDAYDSAAFVDNMRFEQATDCKPGAQPRDRTPLVFIPGIMGSELQSGDGQELWPRPTTGVNQTEDEYLRQFALKADGVSEAKQSEPVVPSDVIRETTVDIPGPWNMVSDVYRSTFEQLSEAGYTEGEDLFAFAFDWRKDAAVNAARLQQFIDKVRADTGAPNVDIMAHSQGGQVTLDMLTRPASVGTVRRVLTIGTPVLGAPRALGVLEFRTPCVVEKFGFCFLHPPAVQEVATNFPGFYNLLPSRAHHDAVGSPLHVDRDTDGDGDKEGLQDYGQWTSIVRKNRNAGLVDPSEALHERIDNFTPTDPDVRLTRIVGDKEATITLIREYEAESCFMMFFNCETNVEHQLLIGNGDGTVPRESASLYSPDRGFDQRNGVPNAYAHEIDHDELPRHSAVIDFAVSYFAADPSATADAQQSAVAMALEKPAVDRQTEPAARQRTERAAREQAPEPQLAQGEFATTLTQEASIIDDTSQPLSGIQIEVIGEMAAVVTDEEGGIIGSGAGLPPGTSVHQLPGGNYARSGRTHSFFMSHEGMYTADLQSTEDTPVQIRVRRYQDDAVSELASFVVPGAPEGANLRLQLDSAQALDSLQVLVDENGDSTFDDELTPATADDDDRVAPTTTATITITQPNDDQGHEAKPKQSAQHENSNDAVGKVTLEASDSGAGVAETYYLLEGDEQPRLYEGPFTAPLGTSVRFRSVDRAGNIEAVQAVGIEDVTDGRDDAAPIRGQRYVRGFIAPEGDVDWFYFDVRKEQEYRIRLSSVAGDYDVELYDRDGKLLALGAESHRRGWLWEKIDRVLTADRYYVRIVGHDGAWSEQHPYYLRVCPLRR